MLRIILEKIPCVKSIKKENEELHKENKELKSYIGYLINENHAVMMDAHGRYVPMDPQAVSKYENANIVIRQRPPIKTLLIYAEVRKK